MSIAYVCSLAFTHQNKALAFPKLKAYSVMGYLRELTETKFY